MSQHDYTTMSDAELNAVVAEQVMGWRVDSEWDSSIYLDAEGKGYGIYANNWAGDMRAAFEVVAAMHKREYWLKLQTGRDVGKQHYAGFTKFDFTGWNGKPDFMWIVDTIEQLPRAVCIAAVLAVMAEKAK